MLFGFCFNAQQFCNSILFFFTAKESGREEAVTVSHLIRILAGPFDSRRLTNGIKLFKHFLLRKLSDGHDLDGRCSLMKLQ